MSTKTEVENVRTSGPEKVLAAILTVFILIGGVWAYGQIGKISNQTYSWEYGGPSGQQIELSQTDRDALRERRIAGRELWKARGRLKQAEKDVTFTGDAYRTEIDAGMDGAAELVQYRRAQAGLTLARKELRRAEARVNATAPAAATANANRDAARADARSNRQSKDRQVAVLRLVLVGGLLGLGYWSLAMARRRRSRLMPLSLALISAAALLAVWMAIDYGTEAEAFREVGPLVISIIGTLLTVLAFIALQRYLARKIPERRVRRRECPFCGFPARDNPHCEGCGRAVSGECSACHQPRRIGTAHCGNCGNV